MVDLGLTIVHLSLHEQSRVSALPLGEDDVRYSPDLQTLDS
jgi:hypothetical protein